MVRARNSFDGRSESDRGVSEVIGSILVFGLLIALLALVQTQVVPNANEGVEAKHSTEVRGDMAELQSALSRSATLGASESVSVKTGMTYPSRLVLYNPPPVQGTLSTSEASTVELDQFSAVNDDSDDYIGTGGGATTFQTHRVRYRVDYNRYQNAPTTKYEHGVLVNDFDGKTIVESKGSLVDGNRISLTLLGGGLQESSVQSASVSTYPVSAPAQTVTVETSGDPGVVTSGDPGVLKVPTTIDEKVWVSEILADQIDPNAAPDPGQKPDCDNVGTNSPVDDNRYIIGCDYVDDVLTLRFERGRTYKLRTAKVGFSATDEKLNVKYITEVTPPGATSGVVEVRDGFNNPIGRPVEVMVDPSPGTSGGAQSFTTDSEGRLDLPDDFGVADVWIAGGSYSPGAGAACSAALECAHVTGGALPAGSTVRVNAVTQPNGPNSNRIAFKFDNTGDTSTKIESIQLGYATQRTEQELTLTGGGALAGDPSTTLVDDGPDSITSITDTATGTTYQPPSGQSGSPKGARENLDPVTFTDGSGNLPTLKASSNNPREIVFTLNDPVSTQDRDSVDVSVTVYYADGSSATYSRTLFQPDGQSGQSP